MWDFKLNNVFGILTKTLPFIIFRLLIYLAVAFGYMIAIGVGATIGYALSSFGSESGGGTAIGGLIGFGVASFALYWFREYILYLVKAGHIAVMVELMDGNELPEGKGQIDYAQSKVKERFAQTSILFGIDQLIKGILKALNRMLFTLAAFLPIPGLEGLVGFANKIMNASLTYTDEVILAYNFKIRATNPWAASKDALIMYAQNYKVMLKNAFWLVLFMYALTFIIFLVILGPIAVIASIFPGSSGFWAFVMAIIFAWCLKAAVLEPFAIAGLMQVYFVAIDGQVPNPEWDEKLSNVSSKFRDLKEKALGATPPPAGAEA